MLKSARRSVFPALAAPAFLIAAVAVALAGPAAIERPLNRAFAH